MKEKLLLIGYRAWGDWIYASPVIPILTEKYDVYLEINRKGHCLFGDDPRFKQIAVFAEFEGKAQDEYPDLFAKRWAEIREQVKPDVEINLNGTCEVTCIGERFQDEFYWPVGERRSWYGPNGFYDAVFRRCGISMDQPISLMGLYFDEEQEAHVKAWREKYKDNFVVILPIAGSTAQKIFHNYRDVAEAILDKYPDAVIYMAGDDACSDYVPQHERVKNICGNRLPFKQAVHMTKYADMVLGPETGLLAAAGMFGTPKVILATTSSVWQMTQYQKNDFSIQAPVPCSPCHRAIYFEADCETPVRDQDGKFQATACSKMFGVDNIMPRVDYVYRNLRKTK